MRIFVIAAVLLSLFAVVLVVVPVAPSGAVQFVDTPTQEFSPCQVIAASLYIRAIPAANGRIVGSLLRGTIVFPYGESPDLLWWQLASGYVSKTWVTCDIAYAPSIQAWTPLPTRTNDPPPFGLSPTPTLTTVALNTATSTPSPSPTPTSTATATVPPSATATTSPSPTVTPTATLHGVFQTATAQATAYSAYQCVRITASAGVNVRDLPSLRSPIIGKRAFGSIVRIIDHPLTADNYVWGSIPERGWLALGPVSGTPFTLRVECP